MPVYEYACGKCGNEFEVEQRITDDPVRTCPSCRSRKVKRLISQTSFVLKGGGWYSDLYATPKKDAPDAKGDGAGASADSSKEGGGKESKGKDGKGKDAGTSSDSGSKSPSKGSSSKGSPSKGSSAKSAA